MTDEVQPHATPALLRAAGAVSRAAHARGLLGERGSGLVRLLSRSVAGRGTTTYRDPHGHVVDADLSDYLERAGFFGAHSAPVLRHMVALLRPGDWAIDAGAAVGLFAGPMAAAVGRTGSVWAVEPLARNVQRLQRLKELNDLVQLEVLPVALTSETATARLRLPAAPGGSAFGSFVATWERAGETEVPTCRLDDLVMARDPGRPLRLLKIDVEGSEPELLEGAAATLTGRFKPLVVCEFHDPLLHTAGSSSQDLLERFATLGYAPRPPFDRPARRLDGRVCDLLLGPIDLGATAAT